MIRLSINRPTTVAMVYIAIAGPLTVTSQLDGLGADRRLIGSAVRHWPFLDFFDHVCKAVTQPLLRPG